MLKSTYNIFTHFKVFKAWTAVVNSDFCVILRFQTASTFRVLHLRKSRCLEASKRERNGHCCQLFFWKTRFKILLKSLTTRLCTWVALSRFESLWVALGRFESLWVTLSRFESLCAHNVHIDKNLIWMYRVQRRNLYTFYNFESAGEIFQKWQKLIFYKIWIHFLAIWSPNFSTEKWAICCWEHFPWGMSKTT